MKIIALILIPLLLAAIGASAKAIVDVAVLQNDSANVHQLLLNAQSDRKVIKEDIKKILGKL